MTSHVSIGIDLGSQSARAVVVQCSDGEIIAAGNARYPSGKNGVLTDSADPDVARQAPNDFIFSTQTALADALNTAKTHPDFSTENVCGIGVCATGSTPIPVDAQGQALANNAQFTGRLEAQAWMWKDHSAINAAADITRTISDAGLPYLENCGGRYSSEWYWAKLLQCARSAPDVATKTHSWIELQDLVPAVLANQTDPKTIARGQCAAGHKGLYGDAWGGWPSQDVITSLNSELGRWHSSLPATTSVAGQQAGSLCAQWASKTGLPEGIPISVGCLDAHAGAVGAGVKPGTLIKIVGTSSCDIAVAPGRTAGGVKAEGLCGAVDESVIPGFIGMEAGQAAVGDLFEWAARFCKHPGEDLQTAFMRLMDGAEALRPGESGLLALDWNNGNRSVLMDTALSGVLLGQSLQTTPAEVFRALLEASAFGSRIILEAIQKTDANIREIILTGGVTSKNSILRQLYADCLGLPVRQCASSDASAIGAAIFGAVAGGAHRDVLSAQKAMQAPAEPPVQPIASNQAIYERLYGHYCTLHDSFGGRRAHDLSAIMKDLLALRRTQRNQGYTSG